METNLPTFIQKRINLNLERIREIKKLLKDFDDNVELYEEIAFLIKENNSLMSTNHLAQTYEEPIYDIVPDNVDIDTLEPKVKDDNIDYSMIDINVIIEKTGTEKEEEAKEIFGVQNLYQIIKSDETDYVEEDDMALFTRYGIKFMNGLAVNVNIDSTPKFVLEKIRNINVYDRFKDKKYVNSDVWSEVDKIEKIYFESEINENTFMNIYDIDTSIEDKDSVKEYKNKKFILLQIKPDYAVSNDYRYTIIEEFENKEAFAKSYKKLKDKSAEFKFPTYIKI